MPGLSPSELGDLEELLKRTPPEVRSLLSRLGGGASELASGLFSNPEVRAIALWAVLVPLVSALEAPALNELSQLTLSKFPDLPLSPAEAADSAIRGHMEQAKAATEASLSGIDGERFGVMLANAGNPPPPGTLLEMWRRGIIGEKGGGAEVVSVEQGIREGRTHDKWIPSLKALLYALPSPSEALDALLEGQTSEENARKLWQQWGGHPDYFTLLFNTRGSAPTPMEAVEMARRGIIPWEGEGPAATSFHQAFLEGPWRNKWEDAFRKLAVYRPPVRSVLAMLRAGAITEERARFLLAQQGADEQTISEILAEAHKAKTQTQKEVTEAQVLAAYRLRRITETTAQQMLVTLGDAPAAATFKLANADAQLAEGQLNQAISRTRSLFIAHKITVQEATAALGRYGLPSEAAAADIATWTLERRDNVRLLTPAQVARAVKQRYLEEGPALAELEAMGYSPRDAWLVLAEGIGDVPKTPMPSETVGGDELSPAR